MKTLVADASALLEYLLRTEVGGSVEELVGRSDMDLHVPALCDVEVAAGLRRALGRGSISERRGVEAIEDYLDLPITRHGHQDLLGRILGLRGNFSAYDATYVALAELLPGALVTADEPLRRAVRTHTAIPLPSL